MQQGRWLTLATSTIFSEKLLESQDSNPGQMGPEVPTLTTVLCRPPLWLNLCYPAFLFTKSLVSKTRRKTIDPDCPMFQSRTQDREDKIFICKNGWPAWSNLNKLSWLELGRVAQWRAFSLCTQGFESRLYCDIFSWDIFLPRSFTLLLSSWTV